MTVSLSRLTAFYGDMDAQELLRAMILREFAGKIAIITSFGADSALPLSLIADIKPDLPILFLETGKHFPETLTYAKKLENQLGLTNVQYLQPDPEKLARIDSEGTLWHHQPNRCCWLRKVEPLQRALEAGNYTALITGRKRYQTPDRSEMETIELDADERFRINPLALWSRERVRRAFADRNLPEHPLIVQGYRSIGCAPCTRPVADGEDERAGRWAHTIGLDENQKTECGIHLPDNAEWSV